LKDTKKLNIMGKQKEEKLNKYIMEGFDFHNGEFPKGLSAIMD